MEGISIFGSYYDDEIQLIPPADMKGQYCIGMLKKLKKHVQIQTV